MRIEVEVRGFHFPNDGCVCYRLDGGAASKCVGHCSALEEAWTVQQPSGGASHHREVLTLNTATLRPGPHTIEAFVTSMAARGKVVATSSRVRFGYRLREWLSSFAANEYSVHSQNGEDGVLEAIFGRIGTTNKYYVEFGVEDGKERNTRFLEERYGWQGLLMDGGHANASINLQREFVTAENIEALFRKYRVPVEPDLLSIDLDGNDYHVWKAIERFR